MITNKHRIGNFTSSGISALMTTGKQSYGFGVAAITYIAEKRMERLLGRSITTENDARPTSWGKCLEKRVFNLLGLDYTLSSTETDVHPEIPYWAGSKDGTREGSDRAVIDIKCPYTLKSFCQLAMPLYCLLDGIDAMNALRFGFEHEGITYEKHKQAEDYYWQLVSNACINNVDFAELIIYVPYQSELEEIKSEIGQEADPKNYWIWTAPDEALPYLPDNGVFRNINTIRFKVPEEDKELLRSKVELAGKLLLNSNIVIAERDNELGVTIAKAG